MNQIKTHTYYKYETTDGREFVDEDLAKEWQEVLNTFKSILKLDNSGQITDELDETFFVELRTMEEVMAFDMICKYEGCSTLPMSLTGTWYYEKTKWIHIESQQNYFKTIKANLKKARKPFEECLKDEGLYDFYLKSEQLSIEVEDETD